MKIGVVIINWNGGKDTCECLTSLSRISIPDGTHITVLVVDNKSTDGSVKLIDDSIGSLQDSIENMTFSLLILSENRGFSGGNNAGIRELLDKSVDYVMLLNNDVVVHKNFLVNIMKQAATHMIVSPKIYFAPGYEFHKSRYKKQDRGNVIWYAGGLIDWKNMYCSHRGVDEVDNGTFDMRIETDFNTGCCMIFHKNTVGTIGFLDEKYFLYFEDVDFCIRAKNAGIKLIYEPTSYLWHKNAQSSGASGSSLHEYYQTRNRMLFGFRYGYFRSKFALFRESLRFLINGGIKAEAIIDFYTGKHGRKK